MRATDRGFLQGEESWHCCKEAEWEYICSQCGKEIYGGEKYINDGGYIQCEECVLEELEERFRIA